jgi:hypothetical protein
MQSIFYECFQESARIETSVTHVFVRDAAASVKGSLLESALVRTQLILEVELYYPASLLALSTVND